MKMTKAEYRRYLETAHWQRRRSERLEVAAHQCEFRPELDGWHPKGPFLGERCGETQSLAVHHRTYETLYAERDADLEVLCRFHHLVRHVCARESGDCPTCGDGPMAVDEADVIEIVEEAIKAHGNIDLIDLSDIDYEGSCSYCESR